MDPQAYLSPHFQVGEFLKPGRPDPNERVMDNLYELADWLEDVRTRLGHRPIIITSGYRDIQYNRLVGGVANSTHTVGLAADIVVPGVRPRRVQSLLGPWWPGGLGAYPSFTHLDIRGKRVRWRL